MFSYSTIITRIEKPKEISLPVPFCRKNEKKLKRIICKLEEYINYKINSEVRWNEHWSLNKILEVGDHLDHNITWQKIGKAPAQTFKRKMLEVFYIRKLKPTLNSQKDIKIIHLFRNGITWIFESEILIINWFYV